MPRVWVTRVLRTISQEQDHGQKLMGALTSVESLRGALKYSCERSRLRKDLERCFFELSCNQRTFDFLKANEAHSTLGCWARSIAGMFVSNTDANTMLGMYKMHVLDTDNARLFLDGPGQRDPSESRGRLLDVGAGDGHVTCELQPLFEEVLATEVSGPAVWRLQQKGIPTRRIASLDSLQGEVYDTVSCLNVLDRCSFPRDLLQDIKGLVKPVSGRLLLAVVLPFRPCVEGGGFNRLYRPEQDLDMPWDATWEESVNQLVDTVLEPAGYEVERLARVPYLCQGDTGSPYYCLDDAVFLLRVKGGPGDASAV